MHKTPEFYSRKRNDKFRRSETNEHKNWDAPAAGRDSDSRRQTKNPSPDILMVKLTEVCG